MGTPFPKSTCIVLCLYFFALDMINYAEVATGGVLQEKVFLEISQNSQENTCARGLRPTTLLI